MESIEKYPNREAYFSVSHLVKRLIVRNEAGEEVSYYVAVRGKDLNGKPRYQALGGGAKLAPGLTEELQDEFGSKIRFRDGEEHDDARFTIELPVDAFVDPKCTLEEQAAQLRKRNAFVSDFLCRFTDLEMGNIEPGIERELYGELEKVGLQQEDFAHMTTVPVGAVSPITWGETTSSRAGSPGGYFRFFHLFDVTVTPEIFAKLQQNNQIKILKDDEVRAIRIATEAGQAAAEMPDGSFVVENVFPDEARAYQVKNFSV